MPEAHRCLLHTCFFNAPPPTRMCLLLLKREEQREGEEVSQSVSRLLYTPCLGNQTCNPGMCPDHESDPQPFGSQDDAPAHRATQPGLTAYFPPATSKDRQENTGA